MEQLKKSKKILVRSPNWVGDVVMATPAFRCIRENFPDVKNGWYQPATGGNFSYGLQTGLSFASVDALFRVGKVVTQDFKTSPTIPFYAEIGTNIKINK